MGIGTDQELCPFCPQFWLFLLNMNSVLRHDAELDNGEAQHQQTKHSVPKNKKAIIHVLSLHGSVHAMMAKQP